MAETLVELVAKISADASALKAALTEAEKATEKTAKTMTETFLGWAKTNKDTLKVVGGAFTAVGAAGLKMVDTSKELNAQLGATGITMGESTGAMRDLALSITDVTTPLSDVVGTFELLARAGVTSTQQLKDTANAFDALGDATGASALEVTNILLPAFKVFGLELPMTSAAMDKFTWLTKNTTVDLGEFGSVMQFVAMYGQGLGVTLEDMIAIMAALEETDPELAVSIRNFMFNFDDVLKLEDRSIQELLREVSSEDLARSLKLVEEGVLTLGQLIAKMASGPAKILQIPGGTLEVGSAADLPVIDLGKAWRVDPSKFRSRGRNTPFAGWELRGKAVLTMVGGEIRYREGTI